MAATTSSVAAGPRPATEQQLVSEMVLSAFTEQKFIYPQTEDPRFWLPGEEHKFTLACNLDSSMQGDYKLYLNLPDPYPSLHEDPRYSIRLANDSVWEEATGYNYLTTITVN